MGDGGNSSVLVEDRAVIQAGLRGRLLDAASEMIEVEGASGLSLRSVARKAHVSHTAPLRHFAGFAGLLAEVAARGYELLADRAELAADSLPVGAGSRARLVAACHAYVGFAVDGPERFALMFRPDVIDVTNSAYVTSSARTHRLFLRLVRSAQDEGWQPHVETPVANASVWGLVHGIAALWTQGPMRASLPDSEDVTQVLDHALATLLAN